MFLKVIVVSGGGVVGGGCSIWWIFQYHLFYKLKKMYENRP